ncbi:hypothetical protein [Roseimaritima multifibrata]|uniref:hypothetical protein n=1 Tax=Roseimaritima multifibrata TaxID=1930274 RepID=UPI001C54D465|nr:hypothetical protein [Roseimaritima multifibrata]
MEIGECRMAVLGDFTEKECGVCGGLVVVAILEFWSFGVLEFWSFGVLEFWSFGVLEFWGSGEVR